MPRAKPVSGDTVRRIWEAQEEADPPSLRELAKRLGRPHSTVAAVLRRPRPDVPAPVRLHVVHAAVAAVALPDDDEGALSRQLAEVRASRAAAEEAGVFGASSQLHRLGIELSAQLRAVRGRQAPPPAELSPEQEAEAIRIWADDAPTSTLEIVVRAWADRVGCDVSRAPDLARA